jgi:hypothetical protein
MRPGEQEALDEAKAKASEKRESAFSFMRELDRMDAASLASCGYRNLTNAEAVHRAFKRAQDEIDKIFKDFVKKFPD